MLLISVITDAEETADKTLVIGPDREAEIAELFADCIPENTGGWRLVSIDIPYDRIQSSFERSDGATVRLELRHRPENEQPVGQTPSFLVFVIERAKMSDDEANAVVETLTELISARDDGAFWDSAPSAVLRAPQSISAPIRSAFEDLKGKFNLEPVIAGREPALIAVRLWQLGGVVLLVLMTIFVATCIRAADRVLMSGLSAIIAAAFAIRHWLVVGGPGDFKPGVTPFEPWTVDGYGIYGPGYTAWTEVWFAIAGTSDSTLYLAGALAGALIAGPVFFIARLISGRSLVGVAASLILAVWPIHALHSATDQPASLTALLVVSALARLLAARERQSAWMLAGAWLSIALAATTRPEQGLAILPFAIFVFVDPKSRRLQATGPMLMLALALVGCVAESLLLSSTSNSRSIVWARYLNPSAWGGLAFDNALLPPTSNPILTVLTLVGTAAAIHWTRWRAVLLLATAVIPLLLVATFYADGAGFVIHRYEIPMLSIAAVFAGCGAAEIQARTRLAWAGPISVLAAIVFGVWDLTSPSTEPTFRAEYRLFRESLTEIPAGTTLVKVRWLGDRGLHVPRYLSRVLDLDHRWVSFADLPQQAVDGGARRCRLERDWRSTS